MLVDYGQVAFVFLFQLDKVLTDVGTNLRDTPVGVCNKAQLMSYCVLRHILRYFYLSLEENNYIFILYKIYI